MTSVGQSQSMMAQRIRSVATYDLALTPLIGRYIGRWLRWSGWAILDYTSLYGRGSRIRLAMAGLPVLLVPSVSYAQSGLHHHILDRASKIDEKTVGFRHGSFVGAPIPIENPTIGTGLALAGGYLFTLDPGSKVSVFGIGGFRTNDGSEGFAVGGKFDFAGGRWTLEGGVGYADLSYDLYIADRPVEIEQQGAIGRFGAAYNLSKPLSIGLEVGYIESEAGRDKSMLPDHIARDFDISTGTADLKLEYDTRDSTIYPTKGVNATLTLGQGKVLQGHNRNFTRRLVQADAFYPVFDNGVVAGQATFCSVDEQTPFFLACSLGGTDSFRGYSSTQHIGDTMASFQLAYRGILTERRACCTNRFRCVAGPSI